jgi:hypothetical protein
MLFGKISPQAVIPQMITPFQQTELVANYITASAEPYILGTNVVNFHVRYGNFNYNEENVPVSFETLHQVFISLSGEAIEDWGTDDTMILTALATEQGTTITEFENWPL